MLKYSCRVARCLRPEKEQQSPHDLMTYLVDRHQQQRCQSAWMACVSICTTVLTIFILANWVNTYNGWEQVLTEAQAFTLYLFAGILFILQQCPKLLNSTTFSIWYSVLMAATVVQPFLANEPHRLLLCTAPFFIVRLVMSMWQLNTALVVTWNLGFTISSVWAYQQNVSDCNASHPLTFLFFEVMSFACIVVITFYLRTILREGIREGLGLRASRNEISAATSLLNTVCDVVVELDEELKITEHSERMASIFTLQADRSVQQMRLQDFMVMSEDRASFEGLLLQQVEKEACPMARVMHAKMRDSIGSVFSMEIFSIQFESLEHFPRYLVGVREFTDEPMLPLPDAPAVQTKRTPTAWCCRTCCRRATTPWRTRC